MKREVEMKSTAEVGRARPAASPSPAVRSRRKGRRDSEGDAKHDDDDDDARDERLVNLLNDEISGTETSISDLTGVYFQIEEELSRNFFSAEETSEAKAEEKKLAGSSDQGAARTAWRACLRSMLKAWLQVENEGVTFRRLKKELMDALQALEREGLTTQEWAALARDAFKVGRWLFEVFEKEQMFIDEWCDTCFTKFRNKLYESESSSIRLMEKDPTSARMLQVLQAIETEKGTVTCQFFRPKMKGAMVAKKRKNDRLKITRSVASEGQWKQQTEESEPVEERRCGR
jgi:hypothetical protein